MMVFASSRATRRRRRGFRAVRIGKMMIGILCKLFVGVLIVFYYLLFILNN